MLTPEIFTRLFTGSSGGHTVGALFDRYVEELREFGQVSTASSYKTASTRLHQSIRTTENYTAGFDKETKRQASERL